MDGSAVAQAATRTIASNANRGGGGDVAPLAVCASRRTAPPGLGASTSPEIRMAHNRAAPELVRAMRASCRSAIANRASDRYCAHGPDCRLAGAAPRRRGLRGSVPVRARCGDRGPATRSAATRRARRVPERPHTRCRPFLDRSPAGRASRRDRTPTGHALVRPAAGTHPQAMACDPASVAAPPAAWRLSALTKSATRPRRPSRFRPSAGVPECGQRGPQRPWLQPCESSVAPAIVAPSATPAATPCRASGAKHRRLGNLGSSKALS